MGIMGNKLEVLAKVLQGFKINDMGYSNGGSVMSDVEISYNNTTLLNSNNLDAVVTNS